MVRHDRPTLRTEPERNRTILIVVMAGLVPAIHAFRRTMRDVDARDKPAHDEQTN
ncbi:hypothetical protein ACQR1H_21290 [Bradyrhizobium sp. HKCCYLRH2015]|uniref:hypothetical protein n=1 Tax=unclassified Bradyrhizobium TaxID=2631580 RepID=UPI0028E2CA35|nr:MULTISPECIES: hypothetical protein [unclassified Bradyrhizobium]